MARKQYSQRFFCLLTEREIKRCVEVTQPITKKITDSHRSAEPVLRNRSTVLSRSVRCMLPVRRRGSDWNHRDRRSAFVRSFGVDGFLFLFEARALRVVTFRGWMAIGGLGSVHSATHCPITDANALAHVGQGGQSTKGAPKDESLYDLQSTNSYSYM